MKRPNGALMPSRKRRYPAGALPKLYGVAVNEKQRALCSSFIVSAKEFNPVHDMPVPAYQVRAIFQHRRLTILDSV
jgi:hypothetical protein